MIASTSPTTDPGSGSTDPPASDPGPTAPERGSHHQPTPGPAGAEIDMEVVARFRVAIARVGRQLRQQAGAGLSPTLHSMLVTIAIHGPLSLSELAAREQVAPPTVTKVLAKLDDQGLVMKERGPTDRRVTLVSLTDAGTARLEESRTRRTAWLVRRLAELDDLDPRRLADAVELLEAIVQPDQQLPSSHPGPAGTAAEGPAGPAPT